MEGEREHIALAGGYDAVLVSGEHLDVAIGGGDDGSAYEDCAHGPAVYSFYLNIGFEAIDLSAEGVPLHGNVHDGEGWLVLSGGADGLGHEDHAGAGAEERAAGGDELLDGLEEAVARGELADGGAFAAGEDEPVGLGDLFGGANGAGLDAEAAKGPEMFSYVTLDCEYAYYHANLQVRIYRVGPSCPIGPAQHHSVLGSLTIPYT